MKHSESEQLILAFSQFFPGAKEVGSYVAGRLISGTGDEINLINPATGNASLSYRDGGAAIVAEATEAANQAQKKWWAFTHAARGRIMFAVAGKIRENVENLAQLESLSSGKPIRDCR